MKNIIHKLTYKNKRGDMVQYLGPQDGKNGCGFFGGYSKNGTPLFFGMKTSKFLKEFSIKA